jgi:hypothetical protein
MTFFFFFSLFASQIEENHRREMDHLRRELGLEIEALRRQNSALHSVSHTSSPVTSMVVSRPPPGPSYEEMRMLNESIRRRISEAIGK